MSDSDSNRWQGSIDTVLTCTCQQDKLGYSWLLRSISSQTQSNPLHKWNTYAISSFLAYLLVLNMSALVLSAPHLTPCAGPWKLYRCIMCFSITLRKKGQDNDRQVCFETAVFPAFSFWLQSKHCWAVGRPSSPPCIWVCCYLIVQHSIY